MLTQSVHDTASNCHITILQSIIDISIDEHSIRVSAENEKGRNYNYTRRFKPTVDASSAVATFTNGVLDITVSKVEEKDKGTKVKIK